MIVFFCTTKFEQIENGPAKFARFLPELSFRDDIDLHILSEDVSEETHYIHKVIIQHNFIAKKIGIISRIFDYNRAVIDLSKYIQPDIILYNNSILGLSRIKLSEVIRIGMINDDNSVCVNLKQYGITYKYFRHKIFSILERIAIFDHKYTIVNSKYLQDQILQRYNAQRSKIKLLYKAIDTQSVQKKGTYVISGNPKILFVKSDWRRGGLDLLIQALSNVSRTMELHIIGPEGKDRELIESIPRNSDLRLIFHGRVSQTEVFRVLLDVDVFCVPSRMEALGVANMEAMIHGVPVVYTEVGGVKEVMNFGKNGFAAKGGDVQSLTEALKHCLDNERDREAKAANAHLFVKMNFSKQKMLNTLHEIFFDALS